MPQEPGKIRNVAVVGHRGMGKTSLVEAMLFQAGNTNRLGTVEEVHRFLAILTGVFIVLHGGALLLDTVVPFSLARELVPFTTAYRPFAVGLGVVAAELTAAVGISNALRSRLPHGVWRRVHYLTLAVWAFATLHGLLAGTDRFDPWFAGLAGMSVAAAGMALVARFSPRRLPA